MKKLNESILENLYESSEKPKLKEAYIYNWRDDIIDMTEVNDEEGDEIFYLVGEKMSQEDPETYPDPYDAVSDIIGLWKIEKRSRLYDYLIKWYGSEEELLKNVRDVYETDDAIYFVTGCGYSIFDADLLGGNADGETQRKFDKFVDNGGKRDDELTESEERDVFLDQITKQITPELYSSNSDIIKNALEIAKKDDEFKDRVIDGRMPDADIFCDNMNKFYKWFTGGRKGKCIINPNIWYIFDDAQVAILKKYGFTYPDLTKVTDEIEVIPLKESEDLNESAKVRLTEAPEDEEVEEEEFDVVEEEPTEEISEEPTEEMTTDEVEEEAEEDEEDVIEDDIEQPFYATTEEFDELREVLVDLNYRLFLINDNMVVVGRLNGPDIEILTSDDNGENKEIEKSEQNEKSDEVKERAEEDGEKSYEYVWIKAPDTLEKLIDQCNVIYLSPEMDEEEKEQYAGKEASHESLMNYLMNELPDEVKEEKEEEVEEEEIPEEIPETIPEEEENEE